MLLRLGGGYAATIVAVSGALREQVLASFDVAQRVLLVSDPSVYSLRATQRALRLCATLGYPPDKTAVLLHGFALDGPLDPADVAAALKHDPFWSLPAEAEGEEARQLAYAQLARRLIGRT